MIIYVANWILHNKISLSSFHLGKIRGNFLWFVDEVRRENLIELSRMWTETYLDNIFDTQPWLTRSCLEISHGRTPLWASSTIRCLTTSGNGRPAMESTEIQRRKLKKNSYKENFDEITKTYRTIITIDKDSTQLIYTTVTCKLINKE